MLDFLCADGTIRQRARVVEPRLLEPELPRSAALQVRDEHGIFRALSFEIGRGYQAALKLFKAAARFGEFTFSGRIAGGDKNAVVTSLP